MPKINREEYEVLKDVDDKWKWIARDRDTGKLPYSDMVHVYEEKPFKTDNVWTVGYGAGKLEKNLFQFIQWEDEEPYNIAELIEEYESGETEVKKIEWLKNEVNELPLRFLGFSMLKQREEFAVSKDDVLELINQLDEPEVLSQELPAIPKFVAEWYESEGKRSSWWNWFYKWGRDESRTELESKAIRWMQYFNEEAFVNMFLHGYTVEKEQKYFVLNNEKYFLLGKDKGHGFVFSTGGNSKLGSMERTSATFELTEQEIKDYDERYMNFAVKVEELEE